MVPAPCVRRPRLQATELCARCLGEVQVGAPTVALGPLRPRGSLPSTSVGSLPCLWSEAVHSASASAGESLPAAGVRVCSWEGPGSAASFAAAILGLCLRPCVSATFGMGLLDRYLLKLIISTITFILNRKPALGSWGFWNSGGFLRKGSEGPRVVGAVPPPGGRGRRSWAGRGAGGARGWLALVSSDSPRLSGVQLLQLRLHSNMIIIYIILVGFELKPIIFLASSYLSV